MLGPCRRANRNRQRTGRGLVWLAVGLCGASAAWLWQAQALDVPPAANRVDAVVWPDNVRAGCMVGGAAAGPPDSVQPVAGERAAVLCGIRVVDHNGGACSEPEIGWVDDTGSARWTSGDLGGVIRAVPTSPFVVHVHGRMGLVVCELGDLERPDGYALVVLPAPVLSGHVVADRRLLKYATLTLKGVARSYEDCPEPLAEACAARYGPSPRWTVAVSSDGFFAFAGVPEGPATLALDRPFRFDSSGSSEEAVALPALSMRLPINPPVIVTGELVAPPDSPLIGKRFAVRCCYVTSLGQTCVDCCEAKEGHSFVLPLSNLRYTGSQDTQSVKLDLDVKHVAFGAVAGTTISRLDSSLVDLGRVELSDVPKVTFRLWDANTAKQLLAGTASGPSESDQAMRPDGTIRAPCGPGGVVFLSSPGYDIASLVVDASASRYNVFLKPITTLDVCVDGPGNLEGLHMDLVVPAQWRVTDAVRIRERRHELLMPYSVSSGYRSEETLSFHLSATRSVRLAGFLVRHERCLSSFEAEVVIRDAFGDIVSQARPRLRLGHRNAVRLSCAARRQIVSGRVVDREGCPIREAIARSGRDILSIQFQRVDDAGAFTFEGYWAADAPPSVSVTAPGRILREIRPDGDGNSVYVLERAKYLTVEALDGNGRRVDAVVSIEMGTGEVWRGEPVAVGFVEFGAVPAVPLRVAAVVNNERFLQHVPARAHHVVIRVP